MTNEETTAGATKQSTPVAKMRDPRKDDNGFLRLGKKIVTVLAGTDQEKFFVHYDLIAASSDFFAKALDGEFKEKDGVVRLEKVTAPNFSHYIQWLYDDKFDVGDKNFTVLLNLVILGNFLQDRLFGIAATNYIIGKVLEINCIPTALAEVAFSNLPPSHPFLNLLVDFWVYAGGPKWFSALDRGDSLKNDVKVGPADFWARVAKGLMVKTKSGDGLYPWQKNRCQYHQHIDGEARCS
ncbi:hypothetical protein FKW77_000389 [Venturia effusa]|uniref:BTB domain-containing protein n=1 Tax=Venturia effusa TaxID=50376 RepID=A0A517LA86_9PEZI|nr:hypothetical protein FKW77_000389 [Venturia effusa]